MASTAAASIQNSIFSCLCAQCQCGLRRTRGMSGDKMSGNKIVCNDRKEASRFLLYIDKQSLQSLKDARSLGSVPCLRSRALTPVELDYWFLDSESAFSHCLDLVVRPRPATIST
ncbi:hypothetical protein P171DRAFT_449826 [Karstenula rhodostoma CBS 690.94]|uniref:Uncharacterized protein n=1 Tax=Karstenula rhodostoma CBS 690.94 TaxID=1392251 RepID=A0A9P4U640_9PLEO|nr:hypothetical protein P171DRAFT_449826 [Karstenula rhodostoma CBS 690.94]